MRASIGGDVIADVLDAVSRKFTLFQLESDMILHKDVTDTLEETEQGSKNGGPEEDVVNYDPTAEVSCVVRVPRAIKDLPFGLEDTYHIGIKGWSVARPKRHHTEAPLLIVGRKEGEFLLIAVAECYLMVASFVVEGDEE